MIKEEEIIIGMMLLRKKSNYTYVIVEKDSENNISYIIKNPYKEVEDEE